MSLKPRWIVVASVVALAMVAVIAVLRGSTRAVKPSAKGDARPNILLLTCDTLRADHTSLSRYERDTTPALARFFKHGVVYDNAYSATSRTASSVISFLTGQYAQHHGVRLQLQKIPPDLVTIAQRLREQGYETAAVVSNSVLAREGIGLETQFDFYDDFVDEKEAHRTVYERGSRGTTNAALRWLAGHQNTEKPAFLWVHYMDPHGPYHPPADMPKHFTHEIPVYVLYEHIPEYVREPGNNNDAMDYIDRYDEEIAYFDQGAGRLLKAWDDLGFGGNSLVIFTADHGEAMIDHELWFEHMNNAFDEAVHVPLAVRGKGFTEGRRVDERVSNIDVAPTILDAAGVPLPDDLDGVRLSLQPTPRHIFVESSFDELQWRGVLEAKTPRKYMVLLHTKAGETGISQPRWYDLSSDPREQAPLPWPADDAVTSGSTALVKWIKADPDVGLALPRRYVERGEEIRRAKQVPAGIAPDIDDAMLERLRALGYVK